MKHTLIAGAVVILILLGVYFYTQNDAADEAPANEDEMTEETNDTDGNADTPSSGTTDSTNSDAQTQNSVVLAENETGNFAVVGRATVTAPGFVVVYKVNSNGATTPMGSSDLLAAGTHTNLSIQLDSIVAEEETIVAILHADNGDGTFEAGNDTYLASDTSPIVADVDVVEVPFGEEDDTLQAQVEAYLEASLEEDLEMR